LTTFAIIATGITVIQVTVTHPYNKLLQVMKFYNRNKGVRTIARHRIDIVAINEAEKKLNSTK
jgi:hypothetical protein